MGPVNLAGSHQALSSLPHVARCRRAAEVLLQSATRSPPLLTTSSSPQVTSDPSLELSKFGGLKKTDGALMSNGKEPRRRGSPAWTSAPACLKEPDTGSLPSAPHCFNGTER